jgi:hypothetical protein
MGDERETAGDSSHKEIKTPAPTLAEEVLVVNLLYIGHNPDDIWNMNLGFKICKGRRRGAWFDENNLWMRDLSSIIAGKHKT